MMDATTEHLSRYACALTYQDLTPEAVHQVKRTLVDTLGCAAGGFDAEPTVIARRLASRVRGDAAARILGTREVSVPDMAAFANTVAVRYLDCNDTYAARGTGHPSDMIPAVFGVASPKTSGPETITAIALAYEVFCRLTDQVALNGWDQGVFAVIGAACGAGKVLGLDQNQMANAISLAITPSLPLGVTRVGELAMWKGCATAAANRSAVFAAQLAGEGMTGPGRPFESRDGLWQHMGAEPPVWGAFGGKGQPFRITETTFKAYPAVVHTQGAIGLILGLREQVADDVETIHVATYAEAVRRTSADVEKWDPQTRETADHSMPYLVATALRDGAVTPATFEESRIRDPDLRPLMKKLTVVEDPEFTRRYPNESCTRVEITTKAGKRLSAETANPKGHLLNPLTDAEVEEKFRGLAGGTLAPGQLDEVLDRVWSFEKAADLDGLFNALEVRA